MLVKSTILKYWTCRVTKCFRLHGDSRRFESNAVSLNISMNNFIRNGDLDTARYLFGEMPYRTVVSYNIIIFGCHKLGRDEEALDIVRQMHSCKVTFNETTFFSVLRVCAHLKSVLHGKQIHCLLLKSGYENFMLVGSSLLNFYSCCFEIKEAWKLFDELHQRNLFLWSVMLGGYVQCNLLKDAFDIFQRMPVRNVISWTMMISGYAKSEHEYEKALKLFNSMRSSNEAEPNEFTLDSVIRCCMRLKSLETGRGIHALSIKCGLESDCSISDALVDLYFECHVVEDAKRVYGNLAQPTVNTSNSLIEGLINVGKIEDAERIFNGMVVPNLVSHNLMIKGYAMSGRAEKSKSLFEKMHHRNVVSLNIMISVLSWNGELNEAINLFDAMKEKNTVTWNSMMSCLIQNEQPITALKLYAKMHNTPVERSRSTFSSVFRACASIGCIHLGRSLHGHVVKTPFETNVYVGTSMVDMYSKCGSITDAQETFLSINSPNLPAWTAMICGCAHHGLGMESLSLFNLMLEKGVEPNVVTFVGILSSCAHAGLVNEGMKIFNSLKKNHGLVPCLEHYACIVDLLGRSGLLKEAEDFICAMPIKPDNILWGSLLNSCWLHGDVEVAERVAQRIVDLDSSQKHIYVIMSNIYAKLGRWKEVLRVRRILRNMDVKKDPGCSWIEVKNTVHVFCVEDGDHPQRNEIYNILENLIANAYSRHQIWHDLFILSSMSE